MRNRFIILIAVGMLALLWLVSRCTAQTPPGLYTLRDLAWDGPGTNWQVFVRLQTDALPIASIESRIARSAVSNLTFNTTYWLSVRAQSNGNWSAESILFEWPQPREDYFAVQNYTMVSLSGPKLWLAGTKKTFTNLPSASQFVGVGGWVSNNISPYVYPQ